MNSLQSQCVHFLGIPADIRILGHPECIGIYLNVMHNYEMGLLHVTLLTLISTINQHK